MIHSIFGKVDFRFCAHHDPTVLRRELFACLRLLNQIVNLCLGKTGLLADVG